MKLTMCIPERIKELNEACEYVKDKEIPGALVECGVWKGGCSIIMGKALPDRELWMYDTFEGLTEPGEYDYKFNSNREDTLKRWKEVDGRWCYAGLDEVRKNMREAKLNPIYIIGDIRETAKEDKPSSISILRLDLDLYEPTKVALEELYPLVSPGGVILIDDYPAWAGCKKAVDEYFNTNNYGTVGYK